MTMKIEVCNSSTKQSKYSNGLVSCYNYLKNQKIRIHHQSTALVELECS